LQFYLFTGIGGAAMGLAFVITTLSSNSGSLLTQIDERPQFIDRALC